MNGLLLSVVERGMPGVITIYHSAWKGDPPLNSAEADILADMLNAVRVSKLQVLVIEVPYRPEGEADREIAKVVATLKRVLMAMALPDEVFIVEQPRPVDVQTYRIDLSRSCQEPRIGGPA